MSFHIWTIYWPHGCKSNTFTLVCILPLKYIPSHFQVTKTLDARQKSDALLNRMVPTRWIVTEGFVRNFERLRKGWKPWWMGDQREGKWEWTIQAYDEVMRDIFEGHWIRQRGHSSASPPIPH